MSCNWYIAGPGCTLCLTPRHALIAQAVQEAVQEAVQAAKEEGIKFDVRANLYTLLAISGACRPCHK